MVYFTICNSFFFLGSSRLRNFKHLRACSAYLMHCTEQHFSCLTLMETEWLRLVIITERLKWFHLIFVSKRIHWLVINRYFLSDEFVEVIEKTILHKQIPFNMDSGFIKLYFAKDKKRLINYSEFSQFLHVGIFYYNYQLVRIWMQILLDLE